MLNVSGMLKKIQAEVEKATNGLVLSDEKLSHESINLIAEAITSASGKVLLPDGVSVSKVSHDAKEHRVTITLRID